MASELAKKIAKMKAAEYTNGNANGQSYNSARRTGGSCGCAPQYSQTPERFNIPRDFPINQDPGCPSPLGGFAEARGLAGFTARAGQVSGGVDQNIPGTIPIVADVAVKEFSSDPIVLPDTNGIVSKVAGLTIRKLSLALAASGAGAPAFDADYLYNNGILIVRQGGNLLYQVKLFKLKVTDFGRLGFDVEINPVQANFNGVTFEIAGRTLTDEANAYDIIVDLTGQWA